MTAQGYSSNSPNKVKIKDKSHQSYLKHISGKQDNVPNKIDWLLKDVRYSDPGETDGL